MLYSRASNQSLKPSLPTVSIRQGWADWPVVEAGSASWGTEVQIRRVICWVQQAALRTRWMRWWGVRGRDWAWGTFHRRSNWMREVGYGLGGCPGEEGGALTLWGLVPTLVLQHPPPPPAPACLAMENPWYCQHQIYSPLLSWISKDRLFQSTVINELVHLLYLILVNYNFDRLSGYI